MRYKRNTDATGMVCCCDCRLVVRDTSGSSRSALTGEYFMGACPLGFGFGPRSKVFLFVPRKCECIKKK